MHTIAIARRFKIGALAALPVEVYLVPGFWLPFHDIMRSPAYPGGVDGILARRTMDTGKRTKGANVATAIRRRELLRGAAILLPGGLIGPAAFAKAKSRAVTAAPSTMRLGPAVVIDQFGYLPDETKIAVARDPQAGFDAADAFTPGRVYDVVDATTKAVVHSGTPVPWNNGATDASSGDKAWHFDFSAVTATGTYFIRDRQKAALSPAFKIGTKVYEPVLRAAVRMFYYQRASTDKPAAYAGESWADTLAGCGPLQDRNARLYTAPDDASTERDLSGGWYDAGDFNRYTAWTSNYVVTLLHAYIENPGIWRDDTGIPESGNGIPDILDETKWGIAWLVKMQNADGSTLSHLGVSEASPPSAAKGPSLYRPANTWVTRSAAGAFAMAAKVFGTVPGHASYAGDLLRRAEQAWTWCEAHPRVVLEGKQPQETDDYGRLSAALVAATYLFAATGKPAYRDWLDAHYRDSHMFAFGDYVYPYEPELQTALLYYASLPTATRETADAIRACYLAGMEKADNWGAVKSGRDPYLAFLGTYTWGSNRFKTTEGELFAALAYYGFGPYPAKDAMTAASHYIHYLHGVNPLGKVYLTNMGTLGAANSVDCMWHAWFPQNSPRWSSVKHSLYGPPPGYLVGGPEETYSWAQGCPTLNAACGTAPPSPPHGQPPQKSYKDFNTGWPIDSWEITEPSCGYQASYIRLLAKFVR